jgi:hypothetical protein
LARARIQSLGITFETIDRVCGWPDRYCATLMSGGKVIGAHNLFILAQALALTPAFLHDAANLVRLEQRADWIKARRTGDFYRQNRRAQHDKAQHRLYRDFWAICGRRGGMQYAQNRTPKQRAEQARKAAKARWRRVS